MYLSLTYPNTAEAILGVTADDTASATAAGDATSQLTESVVMHVVRFPAAQLRCNTQATML